VYHVLNRAVGRSTLFESVDDYAAFEKVLEQAGQRAAMRLLAFCVMPNHWHLVLWPREDGDLSRLHVLAHQHAHASVALVAWDRGHGAVVSGSFQVVPARGRCALFWRVPLR
jgi:putative transposase